MNQAENIVRVVREHWIQDNSIFDFFKKFISKTPEEVRELLDDPTFNAGFVTGLIYARSQSPNPSEPKRGDTAILAKVIEAVISRTRHTPHVTNN